NNFTGIGIDDNHQLVATDGKESSMSAIDCQPAGLFAGSDGPMILDSELPGIELHYFALVLDVDEDVALFVRGRELGFSSKRNRADNFAGTRINCARILTRTVEREYAL